MPYKPAPTAESLAEKIVELEKNVDNVAKSFFELEAKMERLEQQVTNLAKLVKPLVDALEKGRK